jgi:hypothetical protein
MDWDFNEGRWTTVLEGGTVVHAEQTADGWLVLIPAERFRDLIRNKRLKTWMSAQAIVERVIRAHYEWESPHGDDPIGPGEVEKTPEQLHEEWLKLPWNHSPIERKPKR